MLILYTKSNCPFSAKVRATGKELGITFEERDIEDPGIANELIERGGKTQTPYLVDEERGEEMYGSDEISSYLHTRFK